MYKCMDNVCKINRFAGILRADHMHNSLSAHIYLVSVDPDRETETRKSILTYMFAIIAFGWVANSKLSFNICAMYARE